MSKLIIYQLNKASTQSGNAKLNKWKIRRQEQSETGYIDDVMGWVASADPYKSIEKMVFANQADAIDFARKAFPECDYEIIPNNTKNIIRAKSYSNNFTN